MALCDSLQPIVLLTDIMDSNIPENETTSLQNRNQTTSNSRLFQVEQTEPLDLCLNGNIIDEYNMVECYSNYKENGNLTEKNDDDVIFVTEFKVSREKTARRSSGQSNRGAPRRNPVRKARTEKRFKEEYTDIEFDEDDFISESPAEDEDCQETGENFTSNNEDSEDWKVEDVQKKTRQRRRVFSTKLSCRLGRKRKINRTKERKVVLKDLESIIESNLLLIKEYIGDLKTVNELSTEEHVIRKSDRITNAVDIFKQQAILLTIAQEVNIPISTYMQNILAQYTSN